MISCIKSNNTTENRGRLLTKPQARPKVEIVVLWLINTIDNRF